jgi:hypothetical protein
MAVKKQNRNKGSAQNKAYISENRALKNKKIKIAKHQKEHPNDTQQIGTTPNYTSKKSTGYLFGAVQKGLSPTRKKSSN